MDIARPATPRAVRARRGFTIIEVVVVMLILAVATAVTVPALLPPPVDDDLTSAARRIDLLFGIARDSAARGGADVTVVIDSATGGVWLMAAGADSMAFGPPSGLAASLPLDRRGSDGEPLDLPASVRIELSKARAEFRFSATGAAFADSLVLRTSSGAHLVTIDPWNGHVVLR